MNWTIGSSSVVRKAAVLAAAVGLWVGLVLLFAAPIALTGSVSWRQAVGFGASFWAPWLIFLPAAAWIAFRLPLERREIELGERLTTARVQALRMQLHPHFLLWLTRNASR
jgi:hypothetical protein